MKNLARRALFTIGAFVSLAVLSFLGIDALPGDGCTALLGRFGTEAKIAECRVEHRLNDPVVVRLGSWASDVVQGDLGYSIKRDEPVAQIILPRVSLNIPRTGTCCNGFGLMATFWSGHDKSTVTNWNRLPV
jgi:ABC-type dipeptide/oligopeptide/nickel transport system permease component